jgi:O-antigen/teichoic acid export membrane protein
MFGTLLGLALVFNLDFFAVKLLVPDRAVSGQYQAAILLASAPYFFVSSVIVPILFTRLARHATLADTREGIAQALRLTTVLLFPVAVLLVAVPTEVLDLFFPPAYKAASPILSMMAIGNGALILLTILATSFQATGRTAIPARIILSAVAIEFLVLAVVVPQGGAPAAVASFVAATTSCAALLAVLYVRSAHIAVGPLIAWFVRFGLATALGLGLGLASTVLIAPLIGVAVGLAAYYLAAIFLSVSGRPRFAFPTRSEA